MTQGKSTTSNLSKVTTGLPDFAQGDTSVRHDTPVLE